jgi:hypothetical protein
VYSFARPSSVVNDLPIAINPVAASNAAIAFEFSVISTAVPTSAGVKRAPSVDNTSSPIGVGSYSARPSKQ